MGAVNELIVNIQHSILTLGGNGWSSRWIARELGINRETVGKYLLLARQKSAISPPTGSEPSPNSNLAISTGGSAVGRQSFCQPLSPQIEAAVAVGLRCEG
jgi:orotate phosphoribosyltransferase-like protein